MDADAAVHRDDVIALQERLAAFVAQSGGAAFVPGQSWPATLARRASATPDATLLHTVRFSGREPLAEPHACGDLLRAARRAAAGLLDSGVGAGDRVLISVADPAAFTALLLGAQGLGAIGVPVPSAAELPARAYAERVAGVVRDAQPHAAAIDSELARAALQSLPGARAVLDAGALLEYAREAAAPQFELERPLHEIALLQYTSGSTGDPKGAVVLHANAIANLRALAEVWAFGPGDVVYSWLPLFHDMGLVAGLMLGTQLGIPTYVASPRSFAARPDSWLRAITRFRATYSPGPNFAYDALAHRVPDRVLDGIDLSSWRVASNGAELVLPSTCRSFAERFARHGFRPESLRPCYGMAEHTLAMTLSRAGEAEREFDGVDRAALIERGVALPLPPESAGAATQTRVGGALPGHRLWLVDSGGSPVAADRTLGEIAGSGPSMSPGYFRELVAGTAPRSELRTGDLGYLVAGQLFIVDRLKDVLILAGRNHYPTDIERVVGAVGGVRAGAVLAFSAPGEAGTEALYVAAAAEPGAGEPRDALRRAIASAVRESFGIAPERVFLVRPGRLPRTSSGKLRRAAMRELLNGGELAELEREAGAPSA